jgi:type IV pilus assembly protein PilY1
MKKIIYLSILLMLFIPFYHAFAKDTDIYVLDQSQTQIPPDALIILDLSLSMMFPPAGGKLYSSHSTTGCTSHTDIPFYTESGTGHENPCTWSSGSADDSPHWGASVACTGPYYRTSGTRGGVNYNVDCSRLAIAKRAIFGLLDADGSGTIDSADETELNMRMGYMRFDASCSGVSKPVGTSYSQINSTVQSDDVGTYTALVSALTKAKQYYDSTKVVGNPNYDNANECRQKFAILISDGEDSVSCGGPVTPPASGDYKRRRETVAKAKALGDAEYRLFVLGFGGDMPHYLKNTLEWTAFYGNTNNPNISDVTTASYFIRAGSSYSYPDGITVACQNEPSGNLATHTILGDVSHQYAKTNDPGESGLTGYAFFATDAAQLSTAIDVIREYIITFNDQSTSYVAPVVPISQMERTNSGNRMYLGMFKPTTNSFWLGNIKKYGIATENTATLNIGDIIDAQTPPELVMNTDSEIKDTAQSYWSSTPDGGDVDKGGVGEKLLDRVFDNDLAGNPRKIYTYLGGNVHLSADENAFNLSNDSITTGLLSVSTEDEKDNVIRYIHGLNPYGETSSRTDGKRDWILGAFIHSRPAVVYYSESLSVVYAGANDGMLHAFQANDESGEELWAFIPPNLLSNVKNYVHKTPDDNPYLEFGVDSSPRVYKDAVTGQTILIFGQRRGGNRYIALDISAADDPKFLWEISPSRTGYEELGQTWSTPRIGKVKDGLGEKWVAFIGGGYDDTHEDPVPAIPPDATAKGTAIYVVDILTGDPIWVYSKNTKNAAMTYSIPSDIACVDTNGDNFIDRLYVGDMGGRMWRFDVKDVGEKDDPTKWKGKIIFTGSGKIFYPPDVSLERDTNGNYEMIYFGTGDRENPKDTTFVNTLYAVKDRDTPLIESNLANITDYSVLPGDATKLSLNGWYIRLENPGEKCLAGAVIFGRGVYYTTYTPPTEIDPEDPCRIGEGDGRIYIVNYLTGNAIFNLDGETGMGKEDRSMDIGSGIPSGVIISIFGGNSIAYTGVGGGVFSPEVTTSKTLIPINWRIIVQD